MPTKPLTIYKASAGSGKTFTLAVEYIKLLVRDPQNYRYILAVTFTNKATQEMKQRILSKLYGIANSLPDSDDYLWQIQQAFPHLGEREIRERTRLALSQMVHNYHLFRVETIDSFFQRVLRNLARELDLTANLQVVLNDNEVESEAVDNLIENIEKDSDPLLEWIMEFVQERMDDDKSWNVINAIKEFGKNIFSDFYKDHQQQLRKIMDDAEFFGHYKKRLQQLKAVANNEMKAFAERYQTIAEHYGLTDACYFHGASNAPGYFANLASGNFLGDKPKMPNSYITAGMDNPEKLLKKSALNTPEGQAVISEVAPLLREAEEARRRAAVTVVSVDLTLRHVNELRLLGRIEKEVSRINNDNNDYLLSNTQKLLNDLIDKQDSPFIYEKIGGQLRFIMIDEFQDTSTVQWKNFEVLLDDCIAHDAGSLIVGDVKQSIYRWRSGDWHLLQNLNEETRSDLQVKHLDTNYRSQRNIVNFNNAFFRVAAAKVATDAHNNLAAENAPQQLIDEADEIKKAYADVEQKVPEGKPDRGLVKVTLLPKDNYDDDMVQEVEDTIVYLLEHQIPQGKIAIIVRKNKHIKLLADYFLHHPVTVDGKPLMLSMVSDEAFRLDASLAVNIIVKAMYYLEHPNDKLAEAFLAKAYYEICQKKDADKVVPDAGLFLTDKLVAEALPAEMIEGREKLLSTPVVDLAEKLYTIFHLDALNDQSAYVCAFFDQLAAFLKRHIAGIDEFLEEWDANLCGKSIHSDEINGIRLLTVHKSKGLEYDNVIIPYCDWPIEDNRDILWAEPKSKPYNELPAVPLNLHAKRLQGSIYRDDYESEHVKNLVDNLNILYVAFTRASRNLFIIGKSDGAKEPSKLINDVVFTDDDNANGLKASLTGSETISDEEEEKLTFAYGTLCPSKDEAEIETRNIFEQKEKGFTVNIESNDAHVAFVQSNASQDFMTPDDELEEQEKRRAYIDTGNVLHALFASIHDYTEIGKAVEQLEFDGVLYDHPMTRESLLQFIQKELNIPEVRSWFSTHWKVFNECSMLYADPVEGKVREMRPDRVIYDEKEMIVIDFKTGRERDVHQQQVRGYMRLLGEMGYANISGYLWYIRYNKIVKVTR